MTLSWCKCLIDNLKPNLDLPNLSVFDHGASVYFVIAGYNKGKESFVVPKQVSSQAVRFNELSPNKVPVKPEVNGGHVLVTVDTHIQETANLGKVKNGSIGKLNCGNILI